MTPLELRQVTVEVAGARILSDVSIKVGERDFVALVGPNGGGKTTLLRVATGLQKPTGGTVTLAGTATAHLQPRARAARVAWLPQQALTRAELQGDRLVVTSRYRFDETIAAARSGAARALAAVGASALAERIITTLSGGEQQRIALAAVLAQETPLLLLDEPANHLDPVQQALLYRRLGSLWCSGLAVVCVTHDINLLRHVSGPAPVRVVGIARGVVRFDLPYGSPQLAPALSGLWGGRAHEVRGSHGLVYLVEPPEMME